MTVKSSSTPPLYSTTGKSLALSDMRFWDTTGLTDSGVCATYMGLKIRPEMEAALNEVDGKDFAFAVVRSCDDEAWQIITKKKNITALQIERYTNRDDAVNAGVAYLEKDKEHGKPKVD